ncbi:MAG: DNA topoisomerase IB [Dehalococcoidia bacterium]
MTTAMAGRNAAGCEQAATAAGIAEDAGLRYVSDVTPGIARRRARGGFRYTFPDGGPVRDAATLARIRSLAVPPAWTEVWICPDADGHMQATGRDARGRKQYRYHPHWREVRDASKYDRLQAFGAALPRIRAACDRDLRRPGLSREKVLAAVVRLLEATLIRVGNGEYARDNRSYGLTTLRDRHVSIDGSRIEFRFRGKSGVRHDVRLQDRRLATVVGRCREIPGQELFQYFDDCGERHAVTSGDVNAYLRAIAGDAFTAKDFRTWAGTVFATMTLREFEPFGSPAEAKRNIVRAVERVAERLGNTPAVCRKCYIHPAVLDAYLEGTMLQSLRAETAAMDRVSTGLLPDEAAVLALLGERLARAADTGAA